MTQETSRTTESAKSNRQLRTRLLGKARSLQKETIPHIRSSTSLSRDIGPVGLKQPLRHFKRTGIPINPSDDAICIILRPINPPLFPYMPTVHGRGPRLCSASTLPPPLLSSICTDGVLWLGQHVNQGPPSILEAKKHPKKANRKTGAK